jgi:hypothetical protein
MSPYVRMAVSELERCGGIMDDVHHGRHWRLYWTAASAAKYVETIALSPSTQDIEKKIRAGIRRRARKTA